MMRRLTVPVSAMLCFVLLPTLAFVPARPAVALDTDTVLSRTPSVDAEGIGNELEKRKGKIVVLHIWAACCHNCRSMYPELARLQQDYKNQRVEVISVIVDLPTYRDNAIKCLKEHSAKVPLWRKDLKETREFAEAVNSEWKGKLPYTQVYSAEGSPTHSISGVQTYLQIKRLIDAAVREEAARRKLDNM